MKIGLISDSHIPASTRELPEQVFRAFQGVELILHAGDIYSAAALDALETLAPVYAVGGGGVDHGIGKPRVEDKRVLAIEGLRIGMIHKLDLPGIYSDVLAGAIATQLSSTTTLQKALFKIFQQDLDICVFGDTHYDMVEEHEGILMVNPGSPTLPYQMMRLGTVAILDIIDGRARAQILQLTDFPGPPPRYI